MAEKDLLEQLRIDEGERPGERVLRNPPAGLADGMGVTTHAPGS